MRSFSAFLVRKDGPSLRALAKSGADIVIGHHAHTFQGIEVWDNSIIAYGLGNFLMTTPYQIAHKGTDIGLLLIAEIDTGGPFAYSTFFVRNDRDHRRIALIHGNEEGSLKNPPPSFWIVAR